MNFIKIIYLRRSTLEIEVHLAFRLMRNITDAVSWQIPAVQILETKGVKLETGRK